ncbi:MAG: MBL fold metallo-hydrolase [Candidatus Altiarchaeales archaeon]|nr:MBL fold metallo-hydrolase [Candidatus Altiarchaeales archaeon]
MDVTVLKEGVKDRELRGKTTNRNPCASSVTLIKSSSCVIVDTGGRGDEQLILDRLGEEGVNPSEVEYVICTHWHPDHTSNNHLFKDANLIIGETFWPPHENSNHSTWDNNVKEIEGVEIIRTPGHVPEHLSVIAHAHKEYVIAGDAFYEDDLRKGKIPQAYSNKKQFKESLKKVIQTADVIIPGHGRVIELDDKLRKELMGLADRLD